MQRKDKILTKFGDTKLGSHSEMGPTKFKLFNHSCYTHEILRVDEYRGKIKFDKIGNIKMGRPLKRAAKILNF